MSIACTLAPADCDAAAMSGTTFAVRRLASFAEAEPIWRAFQTSAWCSPYQRFDWIEAWHRHIGAGLGVEPLIVVAEDRDGVAMLLPLGLERRFGVTTCRWMGGSHINYGMPLVREDRLSALDVSGVRALLDRIAALAGGIDIYALLNQPVTWRGRDNPFAVALPGRASPSPSYALELEADFDALARRIRSGRSMQTLRRKERKIADELGPLSFETATTREDAERVLETFFRQRAVRFREQGIRSIFEEAGARAYISDLVERTVATGEKILELDYLQAGDEILAIYGGCVMNGRYACYVNSITTDELVRFSPGDILLKMLIRKCCENGLRDFDLGIGDDRYKAAWCTPDPLRDVTVAQTVAGGLVATLLDVPRSAKHLVKSNKVLWPLAKAVRRRLYGGDAADG